MARYNEKSEMLYPARSDNRCAASVMIAKECARYPPTNSAHMKMKQNISLTMSLIDVIILLCPRDRRGHHDRDRDHDAHDRDVHDRDVRDRDATIVI